MTMAQSSRGRTGHLDHLETEVSEVTSLLKDNVEKVLERGERIDSLQSRSEDLECSSSHFKRSAVKIRKNMCWKNCKMSCILGVVIFLIIAVIVIIVLVETKPWESSGGEHPKTTTAPPHSTTTPRASTGTTIHNIITSALTGGSTRSVI
ncbi:vesicle-associated membrane protein 8 [Aplysia californica]|uniref:Vesicle-associated membrane protein 8 n=1 Tax=Aplysia californica TaxID=6500 RepID=A0ABM0JP94_APLCA|nr:vesicle-associated membrane protein 8 [Aplysia californica]